MLSCIVDVTVFSVSILCSFALQSYKIFLRLSSLSFSIGVDTVLLTELDKSFF